MTGKHLRVLATLGAVALILSCAGNGVGRGLHAPPSTAPVETTLDQTLADLDALPTPEGVEEALFSELKEALREALADSVGRVPRGAPSTFDALSLRRGTSPAPYSSSSVPLAKLVSTPPTGEANRVDDLELIDNGDGTYTLTWTYKNIGDYNQDGIVNIQDITPLAVHFEEWVTSENEAVDGNHDGAITIADIVPIAANFAVSCQDYMIQGCDIQTGPFEQVGAIPIGEGVGIPERRRYAYVLESLDYQYFRVFPRDADGTEGPESYFLATRKSGWEWGWVHTWGGSRGDYGYDVAIDQSGNAYVTGMTLSYGAGNYDLILLKYDSAGTLLWQKTWGGGSPDHGNSVAVDGAGNVYVTGLTHSFADGDFAVVLLKYDAGGNLLWQNTWGGSDDRGHSVAADENGNVYVTGWTYRFGVGRYDIVLLKYDSVGSLLWQRTWGGSEFEWGDGVAVDGDGNIYVTGTTSSFGLGPCDLILLKYDSSGSLLWAKTWGGGSYDHGNGVAVDGSGDVYVTGDTSSFGDRSEDVILLKYDSGGSLLWQKAWGASGDDAGEDVALDANGNVYVTGWTHSFSAGHRDPILLKYDSNGSLLWQKRWGGGKWESSDSIAIDASGNLLVSGYAYSAYGSWQDVTWEDLVPLGWSETPSGSVSVPDGTEGLPTGDESSPEGIEDEGGGSDDVLIMKLDPSKL